MLVAVRARAPVQGKPLMSGVIICTRPWPQNSLSGLKGVFLLLARRSAIDEQSRLSTPDTKTMAKAKYARSSQTLSEVPGSAGGVKLKKSVGIEPNLSLTTAIPEPARTVDESSVAVPNARSGPGTKTEIL